jgi:hypothetical protein
MSQFDSFSSQMSVFELYILKRKSSHTSEGYSVFFPFFKFPQAWMMNDNTTSHVLLRPFFNIVNSC